MPRPGSTASDTDCPPDLTSERVITVALRWGDMDVYQHVNNVEFFRLLEEARARLFLATPGAPPILERGVVVASQRLDYVNPLRYRTEDVSVGLSTAAVGRSSVRLRSRVFDPVSDGNDIVYAAGEVTLVGYAPALSQVRAWQPDERAWFRSLA
jgi:acyl-CoA thioester hydrolase